MEHNRTILGAFQQAWQSKDLPALMALVTDDIVFSGSVGLEPGKTWRGKSDVEQGFRYFLELDAGEAQVEAPFFVGDLAFAEWRYVEECGNGPVLAARGTDKFAFKDGKICLKDAFRKTQALGGGRLSPPLRGFGKLAPYTPRRFSFLGLEHVSGMAVKLYAIALPNATTDEGNIRQALAQQLPELVAKAVLAGNHHGQAYCIIHVSDQSAWLLFDWWAHGDITCHILLRAEAQLLDFQVVTTGHLNACVWESQIIEHERRAWVQHMLADRPDALRYQADHLTNGLY
ncbi:MAG: nuclear transport factor 2 family protein [Pseudomonadota bacterium]